MTDTKIFGEIVLTQVPRLLGLGDRKDLSPTFGCFDRYYWHYALKDFSNARAQEVVLLLSLLYQNNFEGNIFYHNAQVKKWLFAAADFWAGLQHSDGSFDENYPNERSFVATAFTSYAMAEAANCVQDAIFLKKISMPLLKSGSWLSKNINPDVANQMAGSAAALYTLFTVLGEKKFEIAAKKRIEEVATMRGPGGYLLEYGGYDIGYLSISISYLAKYYKASGNSVAKELLYGAEKFVASKLDEYGHYDWKNTSRKTQYIYPHGFRIMESSVLDKITNGLENNKILNPVWMDDVFCLPLAIDYMQTALEGDKC